LKRKGAYRLLRNRGPGSTRSSTSALIVRFIAAESLRQAQRARGIVAAQRSKPMRTVRKLSRRRLLAGFARTRAFAERVLETGARRGAAAPRKTPTRASLCLSFTRRSLSSDSVHAKVRVRCRLRVAREQAHEPDRPRTNDAGDSRPCKIKRNHCVPLAAAVDAIVSFRVRPLTFAGGIAFKMRFQSLLARVFAVCSARVDPTATRLRRLWRG
jgi:hypothetical protein